MGAENYPASKAGVGRGLPGGRRRRRLKPYQWLTASAAGVGIATAALAGAGVAYANPADNSKTPSESDSARRTDEDGPPTADNAADDDDANDGTEADADARIIAAVDRTTRDDTDTSEDSDEEPGDAETLVVTQNPGRETPDRLAVDDAANDATGASDDEGSELAIKQVASADTPTTAVLDHSPATLPQPAKATVDIDVASAQVPDIVAADRKVPPVQTMAFAASAHAVPTNWRDIVATLARMQTMPMISASRLDQSAQDAAVGEAGKLSGRSSILTAPAVIGQPPYDAGLNVPFVEPAYPTGTIRNVQDYGATSGNSADNDAAAIQAAISASQPGDAVFLPNGTYHVRSTIVLKSGVSLAGQSRTGTVLVADYDAPPHAVIYVPAGSSNITVTTMKITVANGKAIAAGVRVGLAGGPQTSRIAVKNMEIEKFTRFGVQIQNGVHVLVDGNTIRNAAALGGDGQGYGVIIDQPGSSNNWVRNNEIGPTIRHAILIQESAHHNLIDNNRIHGAVSGAIDLHGEDEYSNEIRYNVISDCVPNGTSVSPNGAGIEIGEYSGVIGTDEYHDNSGHNNWVHHNEVYNCSCGLRITNNSNYTYIEDNRFHDNWTAGILADLAPLDNLHLRRNQIYNNQHGILLYDVTNAVVENNIVRDNRGYGIGGNPGTTGYWIVGNTVTGNWLLNVILQSPDGYYDVRDGARKL